MESCSLYGLDSFKCHHRFSTPVDLERGRNRFHPNKIAERGWSWGDVMLNGSCGRCFGETPCGTIASSGEYQMLKQMLIKEWSLLPQELFDNLVLTLAITITDCTKQQKHPLATTDFLQRRGEDRIWLL
ncbi:hypothetical protein TNCV_2570401 [Trichonephila clavipes]|nr:hypothetical protein TNCV_2570401 [Trichonephila clavipes]